MSVLVDTDTRVIVQGLGKTGRFHTDQGDCVRHPDGRCGASQSCR